MTGSASRNGWSTTKQPSSAWTWHTMITTSVDKAPVPTCWRQLRTIHRHATGNFGTMLRALLDDPKVRGTGTARSVLADPATLSTAKSNVGVLDRLIRADYDREGLTLATFDDVGFYAIDPARLRALAHATE